ncbi:polysaccharide biosynthesis tyrosine autokinase [Methylocapsa palsarum]|uniref:non-specific protein-tyrosine kinase n=1 Tax=Methylocapsa palsarum TaxID=1612308 RepID=A0A1I4C362_9HYPH|nr:polysaccharide biosynthesis tyrosine autokinase [Methylocapsa palsarum]SFK75508.1 succinoglycan biosynthesis transport protein ExoP [Methylocapsa palsarum]
MLQINKRPPLSNPNSGKMAAPLFEGVNFAIKTLRRQLPIVSVIMLCSLALALLYLFNTPPMFTAEGAMVIDTRKVQILQMGAQNQSVLGDLQIDASTVQTQVEVLKSDNIGLAVIRKLKLTEDPEFVGPGKGIISRILRFVLGAGAPPTEFDLEQSALQYFNGQRTVTREGLTYVIEIGFTSQNPETAAKVVNAIVAAYVDDQFDSKYQAARRAGDWLMERVTELRGQASAAERAVADFKEKHNLVSVDPSGRLINDQQLGEVSSQLIIARAATAEAKARLDRILAVMSQEVPDASVADALKSEVIIKLRQQYLELAQRESIFSQRYGPNHLATINLRTQMQELRRSISDEMRKIAGSFKSDYEIALTRENSLKGSLANVVTDANTSGQAQIQLRELKSSADTARTLYDNFLARYMETVQQQDSAPISETRLISPAVPPDRKSSPKTMTTLLMAIFGGGALGFAVAYLREASDGVLRTSDQVEDILHVNCLAMAPSLKPPKGAFASASPQLAGSGAGSGNEFDGDFDQGVAPFDYYNHVVTAPFSRYAEAVRSIKIAADLNGALKSHKVIGLTSTLPNEGKSTLASNLAHLIADAGGSVVLVDADLRSPSLSKYFSPDAAGLIEVVIGNIPLDAAIAKVSGGKLDFLPAGATSRLPHTNEILASAAMKKLIDALRARYDYIIVDLSPVAPIVDVRTTGHIIDTYVYVVEWGKTKVDVIERGLSEAQSVYDRLLGVVLNKVDMSAQSRYERYHGNHYYRKYYSKYGYVE